MSYIIYNKNDWHLWCGVSYSAKHYETERAAKAQFTKLTKSAWGRVAILKSEDWGVMEYNKFRSIEPIVTVHNCLTGSPVLIRASDRGNRALDPSLEGYHTM